ncbi:MAG: hypothetical protein EAZ91_18955 [Cytophagales bacterium]|nr:MAG: hypothetical protein EAZ91_18955 [Cytophagales bacterium]
MNSYTSLFRNHPVITAKIISEECRKGLAFAINCPPDERRYILYNKAYFDTLRAKSSWSDQFVLAHEIAHHVLGHTTWPYFSPVKNLEILPDAFQPRNQPPQKSDTPSKKYIVSLPRRHLHELEADALGLWMICRKGALVKDIEQVFNTLPKFISNGESDSHPSLTVRRKLLQPRIEKEKVRAKPKVSFNIRPDTAQTFLVYDVENIRKEVEHETEEAYAFHLLNTTETEKNSLNRVELAVRDSLIRRARFFWEPVIGGQFQRPALARNGTAVLATDGWSGVSGIRVGRGAWYQKHRLETDLLFSGSKFNTQSVLGDQLRTVERFQTFWLSLRPRYVFTVFPYRQGYRYRTHGLMATAGMSAEKPIGFTYKNYGSSSNQAPDLKMNVNPVAGIGYGLSNWNSRNGLYRVWLLYEPQRLRLRTNAPDPIQANLHTFRIEFSARFW